MIALGSFVMVGISATAPIMIVATYFATADVKPKAMATNNKAAAMRWYGFIKLNV